MNIMEGSRSERLIYWVFMEKIMGGWMKSNERGKHVD